MIALSHGIPGKFVATLGRSLRRFWTAPVTSWPLAWFRIGLASVLLIQAVSLIGHLGELYGRHGIVDWSVMWEASSPGVPDLAWLEEALDLIGVSPSAAVPLAFAAYAGSLLGLLVGYRTRLAAGLACFLHLMLCSSNYMACYGVDGFAQIGLFYCFCFPVGQALALERVRSRSNDEPTFEAWLGLRVLQLHVCIAYTACGMEKAVGEQWWNGEAIWRAVISAPLDAPIDCSFLAAAPWLARVACWTTLAFEGGVVAFVWHPRLRKLWLLTIVTMHVSIALLLNLWTFSATMIVFDIAAFGCRRQSSVTSMAYSRIWSEEMCRCPAEKGRAVAVAGCMRQQER
jgi:hypothetical protein